MNIFEYIGCLLGGYTGVLLAWKLQDRIIISGLDACLPLILGILICTLFRRRI